MWSNTYAVLIPSGEYPRRWREIEAEIAEKVMGGKVIGGNKEWVTWPDAPNSFQDLPAYSTDIAAAWTILPKFADFRIESENEVLGQWRVRLDVRRLNGTTHPVRATALRFEDIPGAICRAAIGAHNLQERLNQDEVIPGVNP